MDKPKSKSQYPSHLTLKIPRLANWHEFARLTQGNILAPDFPPAFQGPGWWV